MINDKAEKWSETIILTKNVKLILLNNNVVVETGDNDGC